MKDCSSIQGVLFDLDNTLFDRDRAFQLWASDFVERRFPAESMESRSQIVRKLVEVDAHGYVTKHVLFQRSKRSIR